MRNGILILQAVHAQITVPVLSWFTAITTRAFFYPNLFVPMPILVIVAVIAVSDAVTVRRIRKLLFKESSYLNQIIRLPKHVTGKHANAMFGFVAAYVNFKTTDREV